MAIELTPDYFDNVVVKMNAAVDSLLAVFLKVARNRRCTMSCAGNSYCRRVNHGEATPVNQHGTYRCKKNEDTPPGGFRGHVPVSVIAGFAFANNILLLLTVSKAQ